jgi:transaldolase / glucose-6-phosphate isomerase
MDSLQRLAELDAVARLRGRDASLFADDPEGQALAEKSLGWTHIAEQSDEVLEQMRGLADEAIERGLTDIVLLGMGGSSLAALVLRDVLAPEGAPRLHVLDTTCPHTIDGLLATLEPSTTLYLVSSKSGGTIEPISLYMIFREVADSALGAEAGGQRFIALTDEGSPLERLALGTGFHALVTTPSDVGGRFSALTAFGLLPSALQGIEIEHLIGRARHMEDGLGFATEQNPAAGLAAFIADSYAAGRDKLTIVTSPKLRSFGLWAEQLIAESLGKNGVGVVPVVELSDDMPQGYGADRAIVVVRLMDDERLAEWVPKLQDMGPTGELVLRDGYDIGAEFARWEHAVALLGPLFEVNPFGQPNVQAAKDATNAVLAEALAIPEPTACTQGGVTLTFAGGLPDPGHDEPSLSAALGHALAAIRPKDYLAVLAYLPEDPELLAPLAAAVPRVSSATGAAVTLEIGPRYLHSTGQLHKGGPNTGVFIIVTTRDAADAPVPGKTWGLRTLFRSQAEGDLTTLIAAGRRVLRVDLPDSSADSVATLAHALLDAAGVVWEE